MEAPKFDFEKDLNAVQLDAVRHEHGPLLILAGAGSGKTRVLTFRIAHLIANRGVSPRRILAVTFTNKASEEMKRRVGELVGRAVRLTWMGTFHSMCARLLRIEDKWGWWTRGFSIYDQADQLDLVKQSMERAGVAASVFAPRALHGAISRAKDRLLSAESYGQEAGNFFEECVHKVYTEYEKALVRNNALDFDDLIMCAVRLLRENPRVLEAYSERFEHVLVDEYQDTSHAQYVLIDLLSSRHRNICVVGDDDQSIYGWRGADITNILDFEKDHPDARVLRLEQNYRSTRSILDAAHDVVVNNAMRKEKKLWTERPPGEPVRLSRITNEYQEADLIRDLITETMHARGLSNRDFAILYRTHAQSRVIEDSLRRAGIAYDIVGGVRFYERAEVKDVLAYLKVIANPFDEVSLRRIVNVPPRKIGDTSLRRLGDFAGRIEASLYEAMGVARECENLPSRAVSALSELAALFERLRAKSASASADEIAQLLLEESGYVSWLSGQGTEESAQRLANIEELAAAASEFAESNEDGSLQAFLEQVSLVADIDTWEDSANVVSLMTLHNAKGLEFTVVFIPGLEEGLLPHESAFDDDTELEEERRLFYVGMTRAKDELHLLSADSRRRYSDWDIRISSRFLDEIDRDRIQIHSIGAPSSAGSGGRPRVDRRSDFPDYEGLSQETPILEPGTRVNHERWGEGLVIEVDGTGLDARVRVRFAEDVEKRIVLRHGKLELIAD